MSGPSYVWDIGDLLGLSVGGAEAERLLQTGLLVSLKIFNVEVDNVIRIWLAMPVEYQRMDHDGMGETIGRCLGVFHAEDGMAGSSNSDWLQHAINVLIGLFRRYGLEANVAKSGTMPCHTGALRTGMSEEAMVLKCTGVGDSYRVRLRRRIP